MWWKIRSTGGSSQSLEVCSHTQIPSSEDCCAVSKDLRVSLIFPLRQRWWYCSVLFCCCHTDSFLLHRADIVSLEFISGWPKIKILQKSKAFVVQSLIKWWIRTSHSLFIFVGGSAFTEFPSRYLPLWSSRYHLCSCSALCETPTKAHPSENRCKQMDYKCMKTHLPFFVLNSFPPDYSEFLCLLHECFPALTTASCWLSVLSVQYELLPHTMGANCWQYQV